MENEGEKSESCVHSRGRMDGRKHGCGHGAAEFEERYLVDPASSHMLVLKIKPCMSKYKRIYTVKLRMAH
jgi:hypothetical protein